MTLELMTLFCLTALAVSISILVKVEKVNPQKRYYQKRYYALEILALALTPAVFFISAILLP